MTPRQFLEHIIEPGLELVAKLGGPAPSNDVRRLMLAIALQESGPELTARFQNSPSSTAGPARGWWQFEQGGGVAGVLYHTATMEWSRRACADCFVIADPAAVWRAIEGHDQLAAVFARLLIYTDPKPLPTTMQDGWDYYLRLWRPGKPHSETWERNWRAADEAVLGG